MVTKKAWVLICVLLVTILFLIIAIADNNEDSLVQGSSTLVGGFVLAYLSALLFLCLFLTLGRSVIIRRKDVTRKHKVKIMVSTISSGINFLLSVLFAYVIVKDWGTGWGSLEGAGYIMLILLIFLFILLFNMVMWLIALVKSFMTKKTGIT